MQKIPDVLFISLEFDRLIKTERFCSEKLYNIHFSALPKYKGVYTSITPILNGEISSGVTLHKIDNGIDTGDIIAQRIFKIDINDSARDLYFKYLKQGFMLFKQNIASLIAGDFSLKKQSCEHSSYFLGKTLMFVILKLTCKKQVLRYIINLEPLSLKNISFQNFKALALKKVC